MPADTLPHSTKLAYGISLSRDLKSKRHQYKDGYGQNASVGIMPRKQRWRLIWNELTEAEAMAIDTFMAASSQDAAPFTWTPQGSVTQYYFEPDGDLTVTFDNYGVASVSLEILEVAGV